MSYKRRTQDRQRALRTKYGAVVEGSVPRTYHRAQERTGGPMANRKQALKRGEFKHKGKSYE